MTNAEQKRLPFNQIEKKLLISSDDLVATHKVKQSRISFDRYLVNNNLNRSAELRKYCDQIFQKVVEDNQLAHCQVGDGNTFRMLKEGSINKMKAIFDLPDRYQFFANAIGIDPNN